MGLEIYWTSFATNQLKSIFDYHKEKASLKVARKIVNGIFEETTKLEDQPEIGPEEPLLKDRNLNFRYLVHKNYKIIYRIDLSRNRIEINDVFDTRQNPVKMKRKN